MMRSLGTHSSNLMKEIRFKIMKEEPNSIKLPAVEVLIVNVKLTLLSSIVQPALNNFSLWWRLQQISNNIQQATEQEIKFKEIGPDTKCYLFSAPYNSAPPEHHGENNIIMRWAVRLNKYKESVDKKPILFHESYLHPLPELFPRPALLQPRLLLLLHILLHHPPNTHNTTFQLMTMDLSLCN